MPASEETWRNQPKLNIVFALSSLAMLGSLVWMVEVDHFREWKQYARMFKKEEVRRLQERQGALAEADSQGRGQVQDAIDSVTLGRGREFLNLPVLDAFNSPLKIDTIWLPDLKQSIGSFGESARFDRCASCHIPIDRAAPGTATEPGWPLQKTPEDQDGYIHPYVTHPRLELFTGSTSPHSKQEFGCTICHRGQGGDTDFIFTSHTPNTPRQAKEWEHRQGWFENHYWDQPQWPKRFIQASCVQCHHDVVELKHNKQFGESAPKLVEGYMLVRKFGCFGCHEINGFEDGRSVGPDLRLEPASSETIARSLVEVERMISDVAAPTPTGVASLMEATRDPNVVPGRLRKVGPSLARIAEKTTEDWTSRWIKNPGAFRPQTRMPHFYGLYNNGDDLGQARGDVEIRAMTHYLFRESRAHLGRLDQAHGHEGAALQNQAGEVRSQLDAIKAELLSETLEGSDRIQKITEKETLVSQLALLEQESAFRKQALLGEVSLAGDALRGAELFVQKGCLACHQHGAVDQESFDGAKADFGPDLTNFSAKLKSETARNWLVQWLSNPRVHHPRGYMPDLQLVPQEAADLAAWLLDQPGKWHEEVEVEELDLESLDDLVEMYLQKSVPLIDARQYLTDGIPESEKGMLRADEQELLGDPSVEKKLSYVGRKTLSRFGCFGCHDVPGYETAKPIGTGLADWGRKDPDLLAFELVSKYIDDEMETAEGEGDANEDTEYYHDAIDHHKRQGFLWQKLHEPRSFDYEKLNLAIKPYDERLRMPQFHFDSDEAENDRKIESVVTFVLGMTADPPAEQFVYRPAGDSRNQIEGVKLLTRFNCVGCHMMETPQFTFQFNPEFHELTQVTVDQRAIDYAFHATDFTAEQARNSGNSDTATVTGLVMGADAENLSEAEERDVALWQPALIKGKRFRVGEQILLPRDGMVSERPGFGGDFALGLVESLVRSAGLERADAWPRVPPPLVREGEKVQTSWLYQFLLNPKPIRPAVVLRMPDFNLNDREARSLAEYFAANDGVPAYDTMVETSDSYLAQRQSEHQGRLGPDRDYLSDAYKILANPQVCRQCHAVGGSSPAGEQKDHGPNLTSAPQRFRSDWLLRWLGRPKRVLPYTAMPENFQNGNPGTHQKVFPADQSLDQLRAVRDVMLNYHKILERQLTDLRPAVPTASEGEGE